MELQEFNIELAEVFSSIEFEEDGGIQLIGTKFNSNNLRVEFVVRTGIEKQTWEIDVLNIREELIKFDWGDEFRILDDHPLLWRFNDKQTELYFSESTNNPYELINSILEIHQNKLKNWYKLNEFINCGWLSLIELCKSSNALFAKGPKKILTEYLTYG